MYTAAFKQVFSLGIAFILLLAPFATHAVTIEELEQQLTELKTQLVALQAELKAAQGDAVLDRICPALSRNLSRGSSGDDVRGLQQFLIREGNLSSDSATGFFGPLTEEGLQKWQAEHGIVSSGSPSSTGYGAVGPKTRARIALCIGTASGSDSVSNTSDSFVANPTSGSAPLSVTFTTSRSVGTLQWLAISFGDGTRGNLNTNDSGTFVTHSYTTPGTYKAELLRDEDVCGYYRTYVHGCTREYVIDSILITVGSTAQ